MLAAGVAAVTTAQKYWWLAPVLSLASIILVAWLNWGKHVLRARRLRKPADVFLTIAPDSGHDSWTTELHVPPHAEIVLHLRIKPRLHYRQLEFIFGFLGKATEKPSPLSVENTFVTRGQMRVESPETNRNHYVDYRDSYHIKEDKEQTKPNVYAMGFRVKTKMPGRYPIRLLFLTDSGEGTPTKELTIIVESRHEKQPSS